MIMHADYRLSSCAESQESGNLSDSWLMEHTGTAMQKHRKGKFKIGSYTN